MPLSLPGIGILASNFHEKQVALLGEINSLHNENVMRKAEDQQRIEELNQKMKRKEAEDQQRIEELYQQMEKLRNKFFEEAKRRDELEGIVNEKWKSTKAPDFEGNIFEAAAKGKLTSIIYLLANGANVNEKYQND